MAWGSPWGLATSVFLQNWAFGLQSWWVDLCKRESCHRKRSAGLSSICSKRSNLRARRDKRCCLWGLRRSLWIWVGKLSPIISPRQLLKCFWGREWVCMPNDLKWNLPKPSPSEGAFSPHPPPSAAPEELAAWLRLRAQPPLNQPNTNFSFQFGPYFPNGGKDLR